MAVSDKGKSDMWRSPLSTPFVKNENDSQDLFQHLEKLIASTVSICRLKGSLECQTGGLITVAEELQRLIRFAVSEISRVERDLKRHKAKYEEEISCLKGRVKCLEEEKEKLQELISPGETDRAEHQEEENSHNFEGNFNGGDSATEEFDGELILMNDNSPDCKDSEEVPPTDIPDRTLQRSETSKDSKKMLKSGKIKTSNVGSKDQKGDVRKKKAAGKSVLSKKHSGANSPTNDALHTDGVNNDKSESENFPEVLKTKVDKEIVEPVDNLEQTKSKSTRKKTKSRKTKLEKGNPPDTVKRDTQPENAHPRRLDDEVTLDGDNKEDEEMPVDEVIKKKKRTLSSRSRERKEKKEKINTKDSACVLEHQQLKDGDDDDGRHDDFESSEKPLSEVVQKIATVVSSVDTTPKASAKEKLKPSHNSSSTKHTPKPNEDEPLGDLSFLIDINTRISDFVNSDESELELPPMTSRQRNDVHKLTKLYSVRGRFGSKTDNRTSMVLVKNADTKQPRAGKVDALLSKLSIAASKETGATPKRKRKLVSSLNECEGNITTEEDGENVEAVDKAKDVPMRKKRKPKTVH